MDLAHAKWRKSSRSAANGCVEVAFVEDRVAIRDSKDHGDGPVLLFTAHEWENFLGGIHNLEFELPR